MQDDPLLHEQESGPPPNRLQISPALHELLSHEHSPDDVEQFPEVLNPLHCVDDVQPHTFGREEVPQTRPELAPLAHELPHPPHTRLLTAGCSQPSSARGAAGITQFAFCNTHVDVHSPAKQDRDCT